MVGSGAAGGGGGGGGGGDHARSKEAAGMMALHEALRNVCLNSDWTYSVFWTIRPRPRCRGGNGCKVGDDNGSLMLMWEDGFCRPRVAECLEDIDGEDPVRKAFSKMSIQLYNYGEGLMGKVASDKCHKWVFKEPSECEPNITNYWQSSFDATIAVIQAGHGLLQLGSCKIVNTGGPALRAADAAHVRVARLPVGLLPLPALLLLAGDLAVAVVDAGHGGAENVEEYLSLESHSNKARRMESAQSTKFKRSFTLPARMSSSTTSTSPSVSASTAPAPPQQQQGMEYRGPHEGGVYSDLMETFLE
uniref:Transcription factor MYC/MYB N-terminal domain-containing protein n=1 Tax=Oryza barthii TaxID=65489 RepID=A0A0D3HLG0_9ORYZ